MSLTIAVVSTSSPKGRSGGQRRSVRCGDARVEKSTKGGSLRGQGAMGNLRHDYSLYNLT